MIETPLKTQWIIKSATSYQGILETLIIRLMNSSRLNNIEYLSRWSLPQRGWEGEFSSMNTDRNSVSMVGIYPWDCEKLLGSTVKVLFVFLFIYLLY